QPQHNILFLLALYAAVCVAHNQPLDFPGTPERFVLPTVATSSNILANAALWAVTSEAAANQAFNINNGDVLRWQTIWPEICAFFSMKPGEPASHKLNATMPAYETVWAKIREKCGLVATAWPSAREWAYADGIFSPARVDIIDTKKIRNAGFDCSADTTQSIIGILRQLRNARLIP